MTPPEIKTVLIRALARKPQMNEDEAVLVPQSIWGRECSRITVREILADMIDTGIITKTVDPDGVMAPSYELTTHGQHKAKQLG